MQKQKTERKDFPSMKEFREGLDAWLMGHGWALDYHWDGKPHAACHAAYDAEWKLQSYGFYLASDWHYRLYVSHRCPKCGVMVMHSQICDENGHGTGIISRN